MDKTTRKVNRPPRQQTGEVQKRTNKWLSRVEWLKEHWGKIALALGVVGLLVAKCAL